MDDNEYNKLRHTCGQHKKTLKLANGLEREVSAFDERYFIADPSCKKCIEKQARIERQQRFSSGVVRHSLRKLPSLSQRDDDSGEW